MTELNNEADSGREIRLTALWALCEAGLGGIGNFINAPLVSVLTGALGVLTISLICWNSDLRSGPLFRAWLVVLLVKFATNPLAPLVAYLSFTFQPVFCLFIYRTMANVRTASIIAGLVCVIERVAFKYLNGHGGSGDDINIWNIKGSFTPAAISDRMYSSMISDNPVLGGVYALGIIVLGICTGLVAYRLPIRIEEEQAKLDAMDPKPDLADLAASPHSKKRKKIRKFRKPKDFSPKQLRLPMILAAYGVAQMIGGNFAEGWKFINYAILFLIVFTQFLPQFFVPNVQRFILMIFHDDRLDMHHTVGSMPELQMCFRAAWKIAGQSEKGYVARVERFVPLFFGLALSYQPAAPAV